MGPLSQAQKEAWSIYIYPNGGVFPCGDPWNVPPGKKEDIEIPENCPLCEEPTLNTYLVDKISRQVARNFEKITLEQLRTLLLPRAVIISPCKDPANEEDAQIGQPCPKCRKTVETITPNKNLRDFAIQVENCSRQTLLPDYMEEVKDPPEEEVKEENPAYLDNAFYANISPPFPPSVDNATPPPPYAELERFQKALDFIRHNPSTFTKSWFDYYITCWRGSEGYTEAQRDNDKVMLRIEEIVQESLKRNPNTDSFSDEEREEMGKVLCDSEKEVLSRAVTLGCGDSFNEEKVTFRECPKCHARVNEIYKNAHLRRIADTYFWKRYSKH